MKKILFVSAATLALVLSSCGKKAEQAPVEPAQVEATEAVEQAVETVASISAAAQDLNAQIEAINAAIKDANTPELVAGVLESCKSVKAKFDEVSSQMSEEEQANFKAAFNAAEEAAQALAK